MLPAENDISSGSYGIRNVRATFAGAYEVLTAELFQRAEQMSGRKSGRYAKRFDPYEMSILGKIISMTKQVCPIHCPNSISADFSYRHGSTVRS
jgi:DNA polymerase sigma